MAAAGGAASILTQVQQTGPPQVNHLGSSDSEKPFTDQLAYRTYRCERRRAYYTRFKVCDLVRDSFMNHR